MDLAIVGSSTGIHLSDVFERDVEIWVFNGVGATLPRYDTVFQLHRNKKWASGWSGRWFKNNFTIPVYMPAIYQEVPMAKLYPYEAVLRMTEHVRHRDKPLEYFTSSLAWAIALAVLQERKKIELLGIDLMDDEYIEQKDCFTFWVGFAAGRGISIDINCADTIFAKELYGSQLPEE